MSRKNALFALAMVLMMATAVAVGPAAQAQTSNPATPTGASGQAATNGSQTPSSQPGSIGASLRAASPDGRGIKLADIIKNGPADQAGLKFGDVIIAVNDASVTKPEELARVIGSFKSGTTITIIYLRKGEKKQSAVTVLERSKVFTEHAVGMDAAAFRVVAGQGDADAQLQLGALYANGKGVPQDYAQAASWYRKAADQGNADAQLQLGALYFRGTGVPQDYAQAAFWYRKAAEQGNVYAQLNLGVLYVLGKGERQNYAQAVSWYRKAAEQGNTDAQKNLVVLYRRGVKGVPKDESQAAYWETKIFDQFRQHAAAWRAMSPRPPLPEAAARERILAENAVQEKNFASAAQHYRSGLASFDTWPEGWFNLALISSELNHYADAADGMKHYLELVPDAPDAKDARTQMIIWEDKAKR